MLRIWCRRHPIQFMVLYAAFYMVFFTLLESSFPVPKVYIHCRLDDLIPFCKYAIVPYSLWFLWIVGTLFYLLWKAPREEFWRLCLPLFLGMTLSLTFCALVPNGVALRPRRVWGSDIFAKAVRTLYRVDTSTNVCPSIHVFNSVTLTMAYRRSSCFEGRVGRWVRLAAEVLNVSIVLSTMLLKQHSVIDVTCGLALALFLDRLFTQKQQIPANRRALGRL